MEKDFEFIELFELYQGLLTDRQKEIFSSHYYYDLSLNEIAEPEGNTRQSVYAVIKQVKNKLLEYEKVLGLKSRNDKLREVAKKADDAWANEILEIIGV